MTTCERVLEVRPARLVGDAPEFKDCTKWHVVCKKTGVTLSGWQWSPQRAWDVAAEKRVK